MLAVGRPDGSLPSYSVDFDELDTLRGHLTLAKQLDKALHKETKAKATNSWLEKNAREIGVIVDDRLRDSCLDDEGDAARHRSNIARLRHQLAAKIAEPIRTHKGAFRHSGNRRARSSVSAAAGAKTARMLSR
ncbi:ATP-dependent RNA helicase ddx24 [Diplonema papillatum]|nr:ATP-dependent RNA helicase ddx24 [Diplonema papillatum]